MGFHALRAKVPDYCKVVLYSSLLNDDRHRGQIFGSKKCIIVLYEGRPMLLTGSPGGSRIITPTLQLLINVMEYGMNIADATSAPRIHHQWQPDRLQVESGFSPDAIRILRARGHDVQYSAAMGSLQTVMFSDGLFYGYSDPRRPGALSAGN